MKLWKKNLDPEVIFAGVANLGYGTQILEFVEFIKNIGNRGKYPDVTERIGELGIGHK